MGTKYYDKSFKEEAVQLSNQRGHVNSVALELGISGSQLSKWCRDYKKFGGNSFLGRGNERFTDDHRRINDLEKQLKDSQLDVEILKKAIAFFSLTDKSNLRELLTKTKFQNDKELYGYSEPNLFNF